MATTISARRVGGGAALVPVGIIGAGGVVSSVSDLTKPQLPELHAEPMAPPPAAAKQPKMIEVELRSGTRIRIDADVKGLALQQVLKLVRSLA